MVEKFGDKDAENGNFNNQMGFRKKSNGVQYKATHYRGESAVVFEAEVRAGGLCKKCGNLRTRCKGKK